MGQATRVGDELSIQETEVPGILQEQNAHHRESQRDLFGLLDAVEQSVMLMDRDGTIVECNTVFASRLGRVRAEILGTNVYAYLPPDVSSRRKQWVDEVARSGAPTNFVDERLGRRIAHRIVPLKDGRGNVVRFAIHSTDTTDQTRVSDRMQRTTELLRSIEEVQSLFIAERDSTEVFERLLKTLVKATQSEYGFLDEIARREDGTPFKRNLAMTNIAWDDASRRLYAQLVRADFVFLKLDNLAGSPVTSGRVVIANDPAHDVRSGGLPSGHPPLSSFMGIPLYGGGELIGVAGVANRHGGYSEELAEFIEPLARSCAGIIAAVRSRRAEEETRLKYRIVADNTYDWEYWIDPECRFLYCSQSSKRITGYEPRDFAADPGLLTRIVHPADQARFARHLVAREADSNEMEFRIVCADGTERWVGHVCQPVFDTTGQYLGVRGSNRDISVRKRAEGALRESEERYSGVVNTAREGIWAMDAEHRTTFVNSRMAEMLGCEPSEMVGVNVAAFMHDENFADCFRQTETRHLRQGRQYEGRFRRKDGSEIWTSVSATALLNGEGGFAGALALFSDITEQRKQEQRLAELEMELHHAARLATLGEMAAGIAHEVNQPLCVIVNFANACKNVALQQTPDVTRIREWSENIAATAAHAGGIVRRLLDFARRSRPRSEKVGVRELLDKAVLLVQHLAQLNKVAIDVHVADDLSAWVQPLAIQQVLVNLLRNSFDALEAVSPSARRISLGAKGVGTSVQFTVSDSGPRVPEDVRARLFEPFFTTKPMGLGLGLVVSRTIVDEHGGRIWADASREGGLAVHFTVPGREG